MLRRCPSLVGDPAAEEWSPWSVCSLTCGQGLQVRTRSCVSSPYGTLCSGPLRETRPCNNSATCPGRRAPPRPIHLPVESGPVWDRTEHLTASLKDWSPLPRLQQTVPALHTRPCPGTLATWHETLGVTKESEHTRTLGISFPCCLHLGSQGCSLHIASSPFP